MHPRGPFEVLGKTDGVYGAWTMGVPKRGGASAAPWPFSFLLTTNNFALNGSSTTSGNQDGTGVSRGSLLETRTTGSAEAVLKEGVSGATTTTTRTQITGSTDRAAASRIIQTDLNGFATSGTPGTPEDRRNWLKTSVIEDGAVLAGTAALSEGRWAAFAGVEYITPTRISRHARLSWADYPGRFLNIYPMWRWVPSPTAQDIIDIEAGEAPRGFQVAARDHYNQYGYTFLEEQMDGPLARACEGGLPWFPYHVYFSNQSTAQTNGGAVCDLSYVGSVTGCTFALLNEDGSANADFAISVAGSTVSVIRASATVLGRGFYDLLLRVEGGGKRHDQRIGLGIGSLTLSHQDKMRVDGNVYGGTESIDNAGTLAAPSYTAGTSRILRGIGLKTKASMCVYLDPDTASESLQSTILWGNNKFNILRLATGAIRVQFRDDANTAFGQITSGAIAKSQGGIWVFASCNVSFGGTSLNRQRLIVIKDSDGSTIYDSGSLTSATLDARTNVALNPVWSTSTDHYAFCGFKNSGSGVFYSGVVGRMMVFDDEIDWSVSGNRACVRSGAGTMTDLSVAATGVVGDGRSITVTAGASGSASGNLTPVIFPSTNAADFHQGIDFGTGFGLGGEEPGNAPLLGGIAWECVARRSPSDADRGIAEAA
jgi:hypothetical protein